MENDKLDDNINTEAQDNDDVEDDYSIDFTTSSAISSIGLKFLVLYLPIFWFSGLVVVTFWYGYATGTTDWFLKLLWLPLFVISLMFLFIFTSFFFSKLLLILINLMCKPKEGIFRIDTKDPNFEFWKLRIEVKKIVLWFLRNWPLPWLDVIAFRWFGVKMDFSSHLNDAWVDCEFIEFGKNITVGQGAVLMSSMVVGNYLIIKKITLDDFSLIGGQSTIAPGTHFGKDTVLGAVSVTTLNQRLEDGWIYGGIPARKLKPNQYAEERTATIHKIDVDEGEKVEVEHDINIEEDKKKILRRGSKE
jgi:carbonic anhydrase/acetyltransferase-like protein (isoleucine patch superfamily)